MAQPGAAFELRGTRVSSITALRVCAGRTDCTRANSDRAKGTRAHAAAFEQLEVSGPVPPPANGRDGASHPAFRRDQASAEQRHESRAGADGDSRKQQGNPLGEVVASEGRERHGRRTESEKNRSLLAAPRLTQKAKSVGVRPHDAWVMSSFF